MLLSDEGLSVDLFGVSCLEFLCCTGKMTQGYFGE